MKSSRTITMQNWLPQNEKKKRSLKVRRMQRKDVLQRSTRRIPRVFIYSFLLACLILGVAALFGWLQQQRISFFTIESVKIEGDLKEKQAYEIESMLTPYLKGDFFKINLKMARAAIMNLSWVQDVEIQRQWPNTVWINILIQEPIAVWNRDLYINNRGQTYRLEAHLDGDSAVSLPRLFGAIGSEALVVDHYRRFSRLVEALNIRITSLNYDKRGSWRLLFENGIEVMLGYEDVINRLHRFVRVYSAYFIDKQNLIQSVDLRYSNGLAIRWKDKHHTDVLISS